MDQIKQAFEITKRKYDTGMSPMQDIMEVCVLCLRKIRSFTIEPQGGIGSKAYYVCHSNNELSRPFLSDHIIYSEDIFMEKWHAVIEGVDHCSRRINYCADEVNDVIYTAIMSFALCYDVFQKHSRKTPGTFFEIILGAILSLLLPDYSRNKHVKIPNGNETISTDIVFESAGHIKLVIPAKITTRERIVQPYAHQRILDSVFGQGVYRSILICVSETQRDKGEGVNDICVPGTIALYQSHLAELTAIYYLDPPVRYLDSSVCDLVPVKRLSELLCSDLPLIIAS